MYTKKSWVPTQLRGQNFSCIPKVTSAFKISMLNNIGIYHYWVWNGSNFDSIKTCNRKHIVTQRNRFHPGSLIFTHLPKNIPCLLWDPKPHYHVHKNSPLALSWDRWMQQSTISYPVSSWSISILSSHLRLKRTTII